jgi:predicted transcriptional regulator
MFFIKTHSITVRLGPELKQRLHDSARKVDLSENDIARHAVRAAVDAMEKNNYRLELPLKMAVCGGPLLPRREPTERRKVTGTSKRRRRKK